MERENTSRYALSLWLSSDEHGRLNSGERYRIGYYVVQVSDLTNALPQSGELKDVDASVIEDIAIAQGYFDPPCNITFRTKHIQFRLKATAYMTMQYSGSLSWPHVKRQPINFKGELAVGNAFIAEPDWKKQKYTIVFRKLNLKE